MRPRRTLAGTARNVARGLTSPRNWLAGYGAFHLGKKGLKLSGKQGVKTEGKANFKNNREKWASEESYVPQTQRKSFGGAVGPNGVL